MYESPKKGQDNSLPFFNKQAFFCIHQGCSIKKKPQLLKVLLRVLFFIRVLSIFALRKNKLGPPRLDYCCITDVLFLKKQMQLQFKIDVTTQDYVCSPICLQVICAKKFKQTCPNQSSLLIIMQSVQSDVLLLNKETTELNSDRRITNH